MKRTVLAMTQEEFDLSEKKGFPEISVECVELEFVKEELRQGSFTISDRFGIEGYVYSSDSRMKVLSESFEGKECEIQYEFDSTGMEPGDKVEGFFHIISNKGEYSVTFTVTREIEYPYSSMGPIKNLFHFANLAKTEWPEALQLFYSNEFLNIFSENEIQYKGIYRGLSRDVGNEENMDEFLVAAKKKSRLGFDVTSRKIEIENPTERTRREITVNAGGWGFLSLEVSSSEKFIELEKNKYTCEDFLGSSCKIGYFVNPDKLIKGKNICTLTIKAPGNRINIEIVINKNPKNVQDSGQYKWDRTTAEITRDYISFRLGKMEMAEWLKTSEAKISQLSGRDERNIVAQLYHTQLLFAAGRIQDAAWVLDRIKEYMDEEKQEKEVYAYYLYLTTLVNTDTEYVNKIAHKVRKMYNKNSESSRLAWIMIYLQEDLCFKPEKRWEFLKEQYRIGSSSPVLYIEALQILWKNPSLLTELSDYETAVLNFAYKQKYLSLEVGERIQFLVGREKEFKPLFFNIMELCYKENPTREMLQTICSYLMKGNCTGEKYLHWYEDAIKKDLRITRLYEYYMSSIPEGYTGEIPKMVLMYFAYQNNLDYSKMAFLYEYVFRNSYKYQEIAVSYEEHVMEFLKNCLSKGRCNSSLMYLYKRFITADILEPQLAHNLVPMLFMCEINSPSPKYTNAILSYDRLIGETKYAFTNGKTFIPIYCEDFVILYEDEDGKRYYEDSFTKPEYIINNERLTNCVRALVPDRLGLIMNTCCPNGKEYVIDEDTVFGFERIVESEKVTSTFKKDVLINLVNYYFRNDQIRKLDEFMLGVKPEMLNSSQRSECIHVLVSRGLYDTAFLWTCRFGPEYVSEKILLRLCSRLLERRDFEEDEKLLNLCAYVFRKDKYDQNVLTYLSSYLNSDTRELRNLYKTTLSFGVDAYSLLERILVQTLYTGAYVSDGMSLYEEYVRANGSSSVMKAYLSKTAFDYFVSEGIVDESIFKQIEKLYREKEELNRVTRLALLKYYSTLEPEDRNEEIIRDYVIRELKKGVVFPFFANFVDVIPELIRFTDRSFVEYRGNSQSRVIMHYSIEHENGKETEYRKEEMDNLYGGIFVKDFILFCGESIQYYITEEGDNSEQLTQSSVLTATEKDLSSGNWRYSVLNDAIISRDMSDYETAGEIVFEYMQSDYLARNIFRIGE